MNDSYWDNRLIGSAEGQMAPNEKLRAQIADQLREEKDPAKRAEIKKRYHAVLYGRREV